MKSFAVLILAASVQAVAIYKGRPDGVGAGNDRFDQDGWKAALESWRDARDTSDADARQAWRDAKPSSADFRTEVEGGKPDDVGEGDERFDQEGWKAAL